MTRDQYFFITCLICFLLFNVESNLVVNIFDVSFLVANSATCALNMSYLIGLFRGLEDGE